MQVLVIPATLMAGHLTTVCRATEYSDVELQRAAYDYSRQNLGAICSNHSVKDIFAAIPEHDFGALVEDDALQITSELAANKCDNAGLRNRLLLAMRCTTPLRLHFPPFQTGCHRVGMPLDVIQWYIQLLGVARVAAPLIALRRRFCPYAVND
jgi:hypothetical protein